MPHDLGRPTASSEPGTGELARRTLVKVRRRLIPFMFLLYIVSYLDRVNVGFAALQMNADLGFSATVYGLGAGIFFLSYVLFEVPSNIVLERVGARLWIARIMISWGIVSAGSMFVSGVASFYTLRFLLGAAEAGFFPGMILYLTYWIPQAERARAVALFMTATAVAGVVGGPISGALLGMDGIAGLRGWQWLFVIEGVPSIVLGVVVLLWLTDRPEQARWLDDDERRWLSTTMTDERTSLAGRGVDRAMGAFRSARVWWLSLVYFTLVIGLYGISFWLPQIIQGLSSMTDFQVGLVSAVPYLVATGVMVAVGSYSDRTGARRGPVASCALAGAAGFLASAWFTNPVWSLASLSLAAAGIWGALGPFWTLPAAFLSGTAAAAGIALINSAGNVGGFLGPYLLGAVKDRTQSFASGLVVLAALMAVGGAVTLRLRDRADQ